MAALQGKGGEFCGLRRMGDVEVLREKGKGGGGEEGR